MNKCDPNEVFINNLGRRIKRSGTEVNIETHCAILDTSFCRENTDCASANFENVLSHIQLEP